MLDTPENPQKTQGKGPNISSADWNDMINTIIAEAGVEGVQGMTAAKPGRDAFVVTADGFCVAADLRARQNRLKRKRKT